ncbi:MAG: hypothetical protein IKN55_07645 [Oscillospiraceae bacterium]|nr:hypothetical protein [Oscillospiraceae bacterium]
MKKSIITLLAISVCASLAACSTQPGTDSVSVTEAPAATAAPETEAAAESETEAVTEAEAEATQPETVPYIEVVEEGMVPVTADALQDGTYDVTVSSSSSMFKIESCVLTVADDAMTAELTMSGTGYGYLYMGKGDAAAAAAESDWIPAVEKGEAVTFTVPVEALDQGIDCAAYSKRKELWYDRTILFRADSLPLEAFREVSDAASLDLSDGEYTAEVTLEGGSGKASVQSPAKITVKDGKVTAEIIWSSNKYDYMVVNGDQIDPVSMEEHSVFEIPVAAFDRPLPVSADTIAMSEPHLIDYTLCFDSASLTQ